MAIEDVQTILQGIQIGQQRRAQDQQREAERERLRQQGEIEQKRIDYQTQRAKKLHDESVRQHDLQNKLAHSYLDLVSAQHQANLHKQKTTDIQSIVQGQPVEGYSSVPQQTLADMPPAAGIGLGQAIPQGQQLVNTPDNSQMMLPTPEAYATQQANLRRTALAPDEEKKISETQASKQADFEKMLQQKVYDEQRAKITSDAAGLRNDVTNATRERIAKIAAQSRITAAGMKGQAQQADFNTQPYIEGALNGTVTRDDILKIPSKQLQLTVMGDLSKLGVNPIRKEQQDWLGDLKASIDTLHNVDQFLAMVPKSTSYIGSKLAGATSTFDTNLTGLEGELNGRASVIARTMMKEKGNMSNQDIERSKKAYLPDRFSTFDVNKKKRDDFVRDLNNQINFKLSNLSEKQKNLIKHDLGFGDISPKYIGNPQQPTITNNPTQQPKTAEDVLRKYGIQ